MTPTSYDDHQRAAERRTCSVCGLSYYVTHATNAVGWRCPCSAVTQHRDLAAARGRVAAPLFAELSLAERCAYYAEQIAIYERGDLRTALDLTDIRAVLIEASAAIEGGGQ